MEKLYCVYILTKEYNKVLYTGVTGDLRARGAAGDEAISMGLSTTVTRLLHFARNDSV
jgi:predicted GIY-YIG superfamily endonuclease